MINDILIFYDNALLYNPNSTFLFFFVLFAASLLLFFRYLWFFVRSIRTAVASVRQIYTIRSHKKIPLKQSILLGRKFFRVIDTMEQKAMKRIHKTLDAVAREVLISENERER